MPYYPPPQPAPTVSLTTAQAALGVDANIPTPGTFVDGASISLAAGTWDVDAIITVVSANTTAKTTAKIWDGTTAVASGEFQHSGLFPVTIALSARVVLGGTTTYKVSATNTITGATIKAATPDSGSGNNATLIHATKVA